MERGGDRLAYKPTGTSSKSTLRSLHPRQVLIFCSSGKGQMQQIFFVCSPYIYHSQIHIDSIAFPILSFYSLNPARSRLLESQINKNFSKILGKNLLNIIFLFYNSTGSFPFLVKVFTSPAKMKHQRFKNSLNYRFFEVLLHDPCPRVQRVRISYYYRFRSRISWAVGVFGTRSGFALIRIHLI